MKELKGLTYTDGHKRVDAWRKFHFQPSYVDFKWYTPDGMGFRLDYIFASPAMAGKLKGARCSDLERQKGLSDHSMVVVDISI